MLIECLECKNEISSRAKACPKCGAPVDLPAVIEPKATNQKQARQENVSAKVSPDAEAVTENFWETKNGGYVLRAISATVALILFRIFAIEWVYGLIARIVLEFNASDFEIALGLAWTTPENWINSFWLGYVIPWWIFYTIGTSSIIYVGAAIIGAFIAANTG